MRERFYFVWRAQECSLDFLCLPLKWDIKRVVRQFFAHARASTPIARDGWEGNPPGRDSHGIVEPKFNLQFRKCCKRVGYQKSRHEDPTFAPLWRTTPRETRDRLRDDPLGLATSVRLLAAIICRSLCLSYLAFFYPISPFTFPGSELNFIARQETVSLVCRLPRPTCALFVYIYALIIIH